MSAKKDETRRRLLDAAEALLLERGFHRVSLEDIAERAGVSRQAVYKSHFASKAELLLSLVQHVHTTRKLDEWIAPVLAAKTGVERLEKTIFAIINIESSIHDLALVLSAAAMSDDDARRAYVDRMEVKRQALRQALTQTFEEGALRREWETEDAVDLLALLVSTEAYEQLVVDRCWPRRKWAERIMEICHATLLRGEGNCPSGSSRSLRTRGR